MRTHRLVPLLVAALLVACGSPAEEPNGGEGALPATDQRSDGDDAAVEEADGTADPDGPQVPALHPKVDGLDEIVLTVATDDAAEVRVDAKIAEDHADRQHGLMEVEHLPDGVGMLFVFEEDRRGGFWMKNTLVPLDIAFSAPDGEILAIMTMEPCDADPCPSYNPKVAYRTALEVPAGWFEQMSVEVGDRISWSDPVPADAT